MYVSVTIDNSRFYKSEIADPEFTYRIRAKTKDGKTVTLGLKKDETGLSTKSRGDIDRLSRALDLIDAFKSNLGPQSSIDPATINVRRVYKREETVIADLAKYYDAVEKRNIIEAAKTADLDPAEREEVDKMLQTAPDPQTEIEFSDIAPDPSSYRNIKKTTLRSLPDDEKEEKFGEFDYEIAFLDGHLETITLIQRVTAVAKQPLSDDEIDAILIEEAKQNHDFSQALKTMGNSAQLADNLSNIQQWRKAVTHPDGFYYTPKAGENFAEAVASATRHKASSLLTAANKRAKHANGEEPKPGIYNVNFEVTYAKISSHLLVQLQALIRAKESDTIYAHLRHQRQRDLMKERVRSAIPPLEELLRPIKELTCGNEHDGFWAYSYNPNNPIINEKRHWHTGLEAALNEIALNSNPAKPRMLTLAFVRPSLGEPVDEDVVTEVVRDSVFKKVADAVKDGGKMDARRVRYALNT